MRVLSLAKKPGTAYARRVNFVSGGALSDDHPARRAGLIEDGIMKIPLDELEDDEVTMDPTRTQVYRDEDMHNWLNIQHNQGFRIGHPETERRPTWPTRREMALGDYRRFNGPEPAEFHSEVMEMVDRFSDVLTANGIPEEDWENWVDVIMPRYGLETPQDLEDFFDEEEERQERRASDRVPSSPSLASVDEEEEEDAVTNMLEYYTNRMDNAVVSEDRMMLDMAYGQADAMLEEDLAAVAEQHHRDYLRRYYEQALSRLPRRSERVRGRQEEDDEDFNPNRTRRRF